MYSISIGQIIYLLANNMIDLIHIKKEPMENKMEIRLIGLGKMGANETFFDKLIVTMCDKF